VHDDKMLAINKWDYNMTKNVGTALVA